MPDSSEYIQDIKRQCMEITTGATAASHSDLTSFIASELGDSTAIRHYSDAFKM